MINQEPKTPKAPGDPDFPTWRYHRTLNPKLVKSKDEAAALGPDWADSPAKFDAPPASPTPTKGSSK